MERYEVAAFIPTPLGHQRSPGRASDAERTARAYARRGGPLPRRVYHSDNFTHNPFTIAEKKTVAVQVDSILQLSPRSYQVRWTEEQRDLNGVAVGTPSHWEAVLQTEVAPPISNDAIVSNPLGFYVTQISWTEQQG